jgi:hypothetical protein
MMIRSGQRMNNELHHANIETNELETVGEQDDPDG